MKATRLRIHNFRSIQDLDIELTPYGLLVCPNNAGKSNVDTLRVFYEDGVKYAHDPDFPKFQVCDSESWMELTYRPDPEDFDALKDEYRGRDGTFAVRKYFESEESDDDGKPRVGLYGLVAGRVWVQDLMAPRFENFRGR
jgi:putative ATP-dependent endonuclease of the OLD family